MIKIDGNIKNVLPVAQLMCFEANVEVQDGSADLWNVIEETVGDIRQNMALEEIAEIPTNKATREAYKLLGKDPSRYRPSAEALLRRVVTGKEMYKINNLVDVLNLISIKTGFSIGGYDRDAVEGEIIFTSAKADQQYDAIGRGQLNIENLPALRDQKGYFGTPTSDSTRTCVSRKTHNFLMTFFCFMAPPEDELVLQVTELLKKYAFASQIKSFKVE